MVNSAAANGIALPLEHYTMAAPKDKRMSRRKMHRWDVSPREAREIQVELRQRWEGADRLPRIRTVAGVDAAFVLRESQALGGQSKAAVRRRSRWSALREANWAIGGVVLYSYPKMKEIERAYAIVPLHFPYVPGLLSFREIPVLLAALKKLQCMPELIFCDGQGYAHPRRFGLASHLGVLLDKPTIGCAKSLLIGTHRELNARAGSWSPLVDEKTGGEVIGAAVRTRDGVKPIYVSQGHRVSLQTAIRLTLEAVSGFRVPRPTRAADRFVSEIKRKVVQENSGKQENALCGGALGYRKNEFRG
jgi:deoxyribonuclease V